MDNSNAYNGTNMENPLYKLLEYSNKINNIKILIQIKVSRVPLDCYVVYPVYLVQCVGKCKRKT
jgi:hypothetical protein